MFIIDRTIDNSKAVAANGNVVFDGSVACAYVYNRLNQPISIETEDGVMTLDYDGAGTLPSRTVESGGVTTKTEYLGPYELVDGELRAAYFDGGYFDADGKVHYYIPDYQGNIVADVTAAGKVVQKASYYPYGEPWLEPEGDNRRLYGGKERLNFGAFHHSDYGPRLLDSRSGRWNSQDPCAEEKYCLSPYIYCSGDPINRVDPNGLSDFWNDNSQVRINDGSNAVYVVQGNGAYKYYKFLGFDILQYFLQKNIILESVIQQQQILNNDNADLQEHDNKTFCNISVQNIMMAVSSASSQTSVVIKGRANDMVDALKSGENPNYIEVTEDEAREYAKSGGFAIIAYRNQDPNRSGHVATFSVGSNRKLGDVANIGPKKYTGFVSLNRSIAKTKQKSYFIFLHNNLNEIIVQP